MSAFTLRETAEEMFTSAQATSTARVFGANSEMMSEIATHRLQHIDDAIVAIDKAIGSPRLLLREPDDFRLAQMREILKERRDRIAQIIPEHRSMPVVTSSSK